MMMARGNMQTDILSLEADVASARSGFACIFSSSDEYEHALIIERAIVVQADHKAEQRTMEMKVNGDTFTLSDDRHTIQGTGKLFGPAWQWTYFKAEFVAENGARIEDENFMTDPSAVTARKKISAPDGKVIMFMDVTMKTITPQMFEILSRALLNK